MDHADKQCVVSIREDMNVNEMVVWVHNLTVVDRRMSFVHYCNTTLTDGTRVKPDGSPLRPNSSAIQK